MRSLINTALLISSLAAPVAGHSADDIRFDVTVLPEFRKYSALFSYPGYAVLVLENNGLSPSPGSKLIVKDGGRVIEMRYSVLRFEGRKGDLYSYELGAVVDMANIDTRFTFPVVVDASSLSHGKITVAMKPPLASLFPTELKTRLRRKVDAIAGMSAQTKVLAYLDQLTKKNSGPPELAAMIEVILLDAYNASGGPVEVNKGGEQALATPDQWMLLITFVIWLLLVSTLLVAYMRRQRRGNPV